MTTTSTRVLPLPAGERVTIPSYAAHLACDPDQRAKYPEYAALAARLIIRDCELHEEIS